MDIYLYIYIYIFNNTTNRDPEMLCSTYRSADDKIGEKHQSTKTLTCSIMGAEGNNEKVVLQRHPLILLLIQYLVRARQCSNRSPSLPQVRLQIPRRNAQHWCSCNLPREQAPTCWLEHKHANAILFNYGCQGWQDGSDTVGG